MPGLREEQKAKREKRILQAAVSKFRECGYDSVRIEDLAQLAGVSVGTVYNYYQNKGDILIATVAMEVEEVLQIGQNIADQPPNGAEKALLKLIFNYYDHSLNYLTKEMWRTAMALSIEHPGTPNGRRYTELDRRLGQQVTNLIATLQGRGEIRAGLDPAVLGQLVFNNLNMEFIEFVKDEKMPLKTLRNRVTAQIAPFARMIAEEGPE